MGKPLAISEFPGFDHLFYMHDSQARGAVTVSPITPDRGVGYFFGTSSPPFLSVFDGRSAHVPLTSS